MARCYGLERKMNINVRCSVLTKNKLESLAKRTGLSQADVIEELLTEQADKWLRDKSSIVGD